MEKKLLALTLTVDAANKVLQYLSTKPYQEVKDLIDMIQHLEPVYEEVKE